MMLYWLGPPYDLDLILAKRRLGRDTAHPHMLRLAPLLQIKTRLVHLCLVFDWVHTFRRPRYG